MNEEDDDFAFADDDARPASLSTPPTIGGNTGADKPSLRRRDALGRGKKLDAAVFGVQGRRTGLALPVVSKDSEGMDDLGAFWAATAHSRPKLPPRPSPRPLSSTPRGALPSPPGHQSPAQHDPHQLGDGNGDGEANLSRRLSFSPDRVGPKKLSQEQTSALGEHEEWLLDVPVSSSQPLPPPSPSPLPPRSPRRAPTPQSTSRVRQSAQRKARGSSPRSRPSLSPSPPSSRARSPSPDLLDFQFESLHSPARLHKGKKRGSGGKRRGGSSGRGATRANVHVRKLDGKKEEASKRAAQNRTFVDGVAAGEQSGGEGEEEQEAERKQGRGAKGKAKAPAAARRQGKKRPAAAMAPLTPVTPLRAKRRRRVVKDTSPHARRSRRRDEPVELCLTPISKVVTSPGPGTRTSARKRFAPLQFWKNEKVVYSRPRKSEQPVVVGVLTSQIG